MLINQEKRNFFMASATSSRGLEIDFRDFAPKAFGDTGNVLEQPLTTELISWEPRNKEKLNFYGWERPLRFFRCI